MDPSNNSLSSSSSLNAQGSSRSGDSRILSQSSELAEQRPPPQNQTDDNHLDLDTTNFKPIIQDFRDDR